MLLDANAYQHYRRHGRMRNGRSLGAHSPPKPYVLPATPEGKRYMCRRRSGRMRKRRSTVHAVALRASLDTCSEQVENRN